MGKIRALFSAIGVLADVDSVLKILGMAAGVSGMTGYLASYQGWHWIIVSSVAVFAFTLMAAYYWTLLSRLHSIFRHIRVVNAQVVQAFFDKEKKCHFKIGCEVLNTSANFVWVKPKRILNTLQGKINQEAEKIGLPVPILIPPGRRQPLNLAGISDLDIAEPIDGTVELEILYGPNEDDMCYVMNFQADVTITVGWDTKFKNIEGGDVTFQVKKADHSRVAIK